jgi:uncharacterized membrane protein YkgB
MEDLETGPDQETDAAVIGEVQLILAEKRTALAILRTGIAVFLLPLSVLSFLIATSKYYSVLDVIHIFSLVLALCLGLVALGGYLVLLSVRRMKRYDRIVNRIKAQHSRLAEFID